jgi:hypothetical protein
MNWIKSNPFVSGLAGITLLLCGILYFLASKWGTQYAETKEGFDEAYLGVNTAEGIPLYPTADLRDGKSKALTEQRAALGDLTKLFDTYRPEKTENISPQAFKDLLLDANKQVSNAFSNGKTTLPEKFFLGFETYRSEPAKDDATGTLLHQMDGIKAALMGLAEARPSALLKVWRVAVPEEDGGNFQPGPNDVARFFSCEVTFKGSEQSARDFLNALGATDSHYFIIRTLSFKNERETPPKVTDAKFEPIPAEETAVAPADLFNGVFPEKPDDAPQADPEQPAAPGGDDSVAEDAGSDPVVPDAPVADSSRILAQVLGKEDLIVFVRFDIAMFLPTKELSKP